MSLHPPLCSYLVQQELNPQSAASTDPAVAALHTGSTPVVAHTPMYINFTQWKATVEILGLFLPRIFWYKPFLFLPYHGRYFAKLGFWGISFYNLLSWGDYELWVFVCYQIALIFWIMHSYLKREGESGIKNKRGFFSLKEKHSLFTMLYSVPYFLAIIQCKLSLLIFQYFLGVFISK